MSNRIAHIDVARGISINLVAMYHSQISALIPEILGPLSMIRMPLFFFLSGVFFSYAVSPGRFLLRKGEALLKPYFSVLLGLLLFNFILGRDSHWSFWGVVYASGHSISWVQMWFLSHLFVVYTFCYFLFRYTKVDSLRGGIKIASACVILILGAYMLPVVGSFEVDLFPVRSGMVGLPYSIDLIPITCVFFSVGYFLSKFARDSILKLNYLIASLVAFLMVLGASDAHINLNERVFVDPVFAVVGAASGIFIVLQVSIILSKSQIVSKLLSTLGGASLYILIFHFFIANESYRVLIGGFGFGVVFSAVVSFFLCVGIPVLMRFVIERVSIFSLFFLPVRQNSLFIFLRRKFLNRVLVMSSR